MSYTALYRKFRPRVFEDVRGQDAVVTTLKNQINNKRISHAYLFCGTRGTGKTTIAKIFARAVNCDDPKDGSPCGVCENCRAIADGASMNVIEIDAASNNSVDDVRNIVEEVSYSPAAGRYKVYIIDEAHMLSLSAFNALLKTLEEPPEYVIFILATTEAGKLPVTILSRCQRYDFKRISLEDISGRIKELTGIENVSIEDKAVKYIARISDGALRDALSLLDQCMAFYPGQELTYEKVLDVLGAVDNEVFSKMLRLIISSDTAAVIRALDTIVADGRDISQFITDLTFYLRNILLLKSSDGLDDMMDVSADNLRLMKEEASLVEEEVIMRYIRILSELSASLRYGSQKRIMTEIALIKMTRPSMERDYDSLVDRISRLEKMAENKDLVFAAPNMNMEALQDSAPQKEEAKKVIVKALPEDIKQIASSWTRIMGSLSDIDRNCLLGAYPSIENEDTLLIITDNFYTNKKYSDPAHLEQLKAGIANITGKDVKLAVVYEGDGQAEGVYPDIRQFVDSQIDFPIDEMEDDDIPDDDLFDDDRDE